MEQQQKRQQNIEKTQHECVSIEMNKKDQRMDYL